MDTGIVDAKRAVESLLSSTNTGTSIAYENADFTPPEALYLACQFFIESPDDPVFTAGYHREKLNFQVFVCDKRGIGTANADAKASAIKSTFKKGVTLQRNNTKIHILQTPYIGSAMTTNDRLVIPVMIPLTVEVYDF